MRKGKSLSHHRILDSGPRWAAGPCTESWWAQRVNTRGWRSSHRDIATWFRRGRSWSESLSRNTWRPRYCGTDTRHNLQFYLELLSSIHRRNPASQSRIPVRKSSIAVSSLRLEIKTARLIHLRRAVSRYLVVVYVDSAVPHFQFKYPAIFEMAICLFPIICSLITSYGVQIPSSLLTSWTTVRRRFLRLSTPLLPRCVSAMIYANCGLLRPR